VQIDPDCRRRHLPQHTSRHESAVAASLSPAQNTAVANRQRYCLYRRQCDTPASKYRRSCFSLTSKKRKTKKPRAVMRVHPPIWLVTSSVGFRWGGRRAHPSSLTTQRRRAAVPAGRRQCGGGSGQCVNGDCSWHGAAHHGLQRFRTPLHGAPRWHATVGAAPSPEPRRNHITPPRWLGPRPGGPNPKNYGSPNTPNTLNPPPHTISGPGSHPRARDALLPPPQRLLAD